MMGLVTFPFPPWILRQFYRLFPYRRSYPRASTELLDPLVVDRQKAISSCFVNNVLLRSALPDFLKSLAGQARR